MNRPHSASGYRWVLLGVGTLSLLLAGVIYAWSILKAPLAEAFGWTASQLALNFTIMFCFFCSGGIVGSLLCKRTSPRLTMIASAISVFAGFFLTSRLTGRSIVSLYLFYGVICGVGIGFAYNVIVSTVSRWFPDKPGVCSGVLMMGFGFSTLVVGNTANHFFEMPDVSWRSVFLGLGIVTGGVLLAAALILRLPGEQDLLPAPVKKNGEDASSGLSAGQMMRTLRFYLQFFYLVLASMVGNSVLSFARDYVMSLGAASTGAALLVGICSVCNGGGRVFSGMLFDALGRRKTMLIANIITILAPITALLAIVTSSLVLGAVSLCLVGLSYGCCPTFTTAGTMDLFGRKHYSLNFGIMNANLIFASLSATAASAMISRSGSYQSFFVLLIGCACLALVLNLSLAACERKMAAK